MLNLLYNNFIIGASEFGVKFNVSDWGLIFHKQLTFYYK